MRFQEWLLLNESPIITLVGPDGKTPAVQNISVLVGEPGDPHTHAQSIQANRIDLRYEDYGFFKDRPTPLKMNFAAPLADGRFLNVSMDTGLGGNAIVDTEKRSSLDKAKQQFLPYPEIRPDWGSFAQFMNQNMVTQHAPGDAYRGSNRAAI